MLLRIAFLACFLFFIQALNSQNLSGLQNKRLIKSDDISSMIESGIGILLGGKIPGNVDSVVISYDAEKNLKGKIYYKEYSGGYFTVSCLAADRKVQAEMSKAQFTQSSSASPVEFSIDLKSGLPDNSEYESVFLRIDVSKRQGGTGNVSVFQLNKKWKTNLDAKNVVINVPLVPVGKAANLTNEKKDITPAKTIYFDPSKTYLRPEVIKAIKPGIKPGGGNSFSNFNYAAAAQESISGTWVNIDQNTQGITKLIIVNDNSIQAFGRCQPQDCDWGKVSLASSGGNNYRALYTTSFRNTTFNLSLNGTELVLNGADVYKDGRPARNYSYTFKKDIKIVFAATQIYTMKDIAKMTPPSGGAADKTPKGPDKNLQLYLLDGLSADVDFKRPQDISNINISVFADKNITSGIYYILPADFHLKWETRTEPEKGYDFRILYGTQTNGGEETDSDAPVRMSASLTTGISSRERNFVKELLKSVRPDFVDIRYLPLRENPQFTFQSTLGSQFNIPEGKIKVESYTDLNSDIKVAWQTDVTTKDFIQSSLTSREGISASVILKPADESILDQQIPATINLADIRTLGKMNLNPANWRSQKWRNLTPYPLRLKYIHVLKKEINGTKPIIYSWSLNDAIVPSQAQAEFENSRIPVWIDTDPSVVMWVEYSVEECNSCDLKVLDAVTGGVAGTKNQQVKFTIPPAVFDTLHASYFLITVRSKQGDPKGTELKEFEAIKITKEGTGSNSAGPLFIPANGAIEFEYKITVASADGDFYPVRDWIPATEKDVLLGKTKLKELFKGIIPGIE